MNKEEFNIGHLSTAYHTNFLLMQRGIFERDIGKKINWMLFGTGPAMIQAFKEGKLDMGYMGLPPATIGIDQGVPIKCVAGGHVEGTIMAGKEKYKSLDQFNDNFSETLSQFRGKSVGVTSKGSIHEVIISKYLNETSLVDEIDLRCYKQAEFIALDMYKGKIEAGVGTPSLAVFASTLLNSRVIIPSNKLWDYNPSYGVFFHEDVINNSPEIIMTFLRCHKRASRFLRENPKRASEYVSDVFKIVESEFINDVLNLSPKYCIALPEEYIKSTMEFTETLYKLGYINNRLQVEDIFNFDFIKDAHPEEHHYVESTIP
ncbi:MAG: ABC transporter substrate-binding protein [Candidatus Hodarchaeota archaeon]